MEELIPARRLPARILARVDEAIRLNPGIGGGPSPPPLGFSVVKEESTSIRHGYRRFGAILSRAADVMCGLGLELKDDEIA